MESNVFMQTMDLDLMPYSVGGDSTINRIAFVSELKTTGRTHNRVMIIEVFGAMRVIPPSEAGLQVKPTVFSFPRFPSIGMRSIGI